MRLAIDRPVLLDRLAAEIQSALSLPAPPPLSGRNPADGVPGVVVAPDDLNAGVVADVIAAHPDADVVAASAASNESTIRDRAEQALAANAEFLALVSPTNAQTLAQVKALTRQNNGLIRLVLGRLESAD